MRRSRKVSGVGRRAHGVSPAAQDGASFSVGCSGFVASEETPDARRPATRACLTGIFTAVCLIVSILPAQPLTPVALQAKPAPVVAADSTRADSLVAKPVLRADTARVAMHHFNHRQQIITGGAIMATLIGVMVVMNNYNPRVPPQ